MFFSMPRYASWVDDLSLQLEGQSSLLVNSSQPAAQAAQAPEVHRWVRQLGDYQHHVELIPFIWEWIDIDDGYNLI